MTIDAKTLGLPGVLVFLSRSIDVGLGAIQRHQLTIKDARSAANALPW